MIQVTLEQKRALHKLHTLRNVAIQYREALETFYDKWYKEFDDTGLYRLVYEEMHRMCINITTLNTINEQYALKYSLGGRGECSTKLIRRQR